MVSALGEDATREAFLQPLSNVGVPDRFVLSDEHGCKECVRGVAFHIINETEHMIKKFCANATKPAIIRLCKVAEEHQDIFTGFVMAKVRPHALAFEYCLGAKVCQWPKDEQLIEDPSVDMLEETIPSIMLPENSDPLSLQAAAFDMLPSDGADHIEASIFREVGGPSTPVFHKLFRTGRNWGEVRPEENDVSSHKCGCFKCVCATAKAVMVYKIHKILMWCVEHKHDSKVQKVCEAAYKSPGVAFGWLLGTVEPWKFSYGFCLGGRRCQHPFKAGIPGLPHHEQHVQEVEFMAA